MPGVKSIISKASGALADAYIEHGDKIYFGNLFLEVCMSYCLTKYLQTVVCYFIYCFVFLWLFSL